jgi:hypothetical protein
MSNTNDDITMKNDSKKDSEKSEKEENTINTLYHDYKKMILTMDKASYIKDTRTLNQLYKQMNKYRTEFQENHFSYISEVFLNNSTNFSNIKPLDSAEKDKLSILFKFSTKHLTRITNDIPEVYFFNCLLLILKLIDAKLHSEAFEKLKFLIGKFKENKYQTMNHLKAKTYYYYCLEAERLGVNSEIMK